MIGRASIATLAAALSVAAAMGLASCGGDTDGPTSGSTGHGPDDPYVPAHTWAECQSSDQAFVRRALLAINGRRPWGQGEVNAYEDVIKGVRAADHQAAGKLGTIGDSLPPEGGDLESARKIVVLQMMREGAFRERWSDFIMDALHVVRIEVKSQESCYGSPKGAPVDDGSLAAWVRDHDASEKTPIKAGFKMGDLLSSAVELDDLSVVYRAHLFAMMSRPLTGANVDFLPMERIRRQDFGAVFDAAYVHRDVVCLACHNSEFSVTYNEDPALNRAWPVPGLFEVALYGASDGKHPIEEQATKGTDDLRAHSVFRVADVVGNGESPFGWSQQCGAFSVPTQPDPLNIDAFFGSIRSTAADPTKGLFASVWDLERALHRGVDLLAAHGLRRLTGDQLADADEALAYLVAENIVEQVWAEVIGTKLTIANYFPRTEVQRDILTSLTEHFVASHFSLKTLLLDIIAHPVFNLKAPDEGCGVAAYEIPNILDPWTVSDGDLSKRGNSPADGVYSVSSRPLVRSLHRAMEWPLIPDYPNAEADDAFQAAIGIFIKDGDPGFRGLDFQGRLTWEAAYGACPPLSGNDFIAKIVAEAAATPGATLGDAVIALKDRLVGNPSIDPGGEAADLEALIGAPLASTDLAGLDQQLRGVCGVLVSTPDFMLGGLVPKDTRDVPELTPPDVGYDATCNYLGGLLANTTPSYTVVCGGSATVTRN